MQRKRIINVGVSLVSVSLGAYYSKEIRDASIGALRFGRTAAAVGTKIIFVYYFSFHSYIVIGRWDRLWLTITDHSIPKQLI